ncbi:hypothetical protein D3C85_1146790 [compost metagenome]
MIEVGSSHTTSSTSWAARTKLTTDSPIPAAVSITSTSRLSPMSLNAWIRPACWAGLRCTMLWVPEAAGTIRMPPGPCSNTSRSSQRPSITSASVRLGVSPSNTSTFANPRSASSNITRLPSSARARDKFTDTLVLPTPPLPPVTAITCTGCMLPMCFLYLVVLDAGYMTGCAFNTEQCMAGHRCRYKSSHCYLSQPAWSDCGRYQRTCQPWLLRWVLPASAHSRRD